MSRKGSPRLVRFCRTPSTDSQTIARFINMVMQSGKKSVAEKIVYGAIDVIGEKNPNALELVEKALGNVAPAVEVKSRRVGGATYQVPVEVRSSRRMALAMRWLIERPQARRDLDAAQARRRAARRLGEAAAAP
jgi:small subunit ribosomal protein S7